MASHATDVLVVPVLLSEVRPAKQEDEGDIRDEGRGSRRDGCWPLQPMKLHTLAIDMSDEGLMGSDEAVHGLVVAAATGQDEAVVALEMR